MKYERVIPRDLFNESKLLKCMGRLTLLIHDNQAPKGLKFELYGNEFNIDLMRDGHLHITNLQIDYKNIPLIFKCTYNSKNNYNLLCEDDFVEYLVFEEDGKFSEEFMNLLKELDNE